MKADISQLVGLVAEKGSITKAAELLGISQPALTNHIKKLENELGVKLFNRGTSPLALTYAGQRYLENTKKLLDVKKSMDREMSDIARGITGRVRIGVTVEQGAAWLPLFLPDFISRYPKVEITIREGVSETFEKWLLDGEIDLCVMALPVMSPDIQYEPFINSAIYLVSSRGHPFAREVNLEVNSPLKPHYIDPQRLEGERFIMLMPQQGLCRIASQILDKHGVRVNTVMRLTSNRTAAHLAGAGLGLTFTTYNGCLSALAIPQIRPVFYTVEDPPFFRYVTIAYRKDPVFTPAAQYLLQLMRDCLRRQFSKDGILIQRPAL